VPNLHPFISTVVTKVRIGIRRVYEYMYVKATYFQFSGDVIGHKKISRFILTADMTGITGKSRDKLHKYAIHSLVGNKGSSGGIKLVGNRS